MICRAQPGDSGLGIGLYYTTPLSSPPTVSIGSDTISAQMADTLHEYAASLSIPYESGIKVEGEDASGKRFFFRLDYSNSSRETLSEGLDIYSRDGSCLLTLDSSNVPLGSVGILSSRYPVPRTGLDSISRQGGPAYSIATLPERSVLAGGNILTLRYWQPLSPALELSLRVHRWNEVSHFWELVGGVVDTGRNEVQVGITRTGVYTLFTTNIEESPNSGDAPLELNQNRPNPFQDQTTFSLVLRKPMHVGVGVYDLMGREVRRILDESKPAGEYSVDWDGIDGNGIQVPDGVYFCRAMGEGSVQAVKMIVQRRGE
jgi:hypothetical protein